VVAANDLLAIGVIRSLMDHGFNVPHDISVVGVDAAQNGSPTSPPTTATGF